MTDKRTPLHGGTQLVTFNGGSDIRKSLPFNATSVNIDNWSPYWYLLNPVKEYIPPFQHGVNIELPFVNNFEFVCVAPPGIEQSIITPTTGIPGNDKPIYALFSSLNTNNDAGNSALVQAANITETDTTAQGPTPLVLQSIDLTLYNGVYFYVINRQTSVVRIQFVFGSITMGTYTLYTNERVLFTIPKLGQLLTISADSPSAANIDIDYAYRPYIGYAEFNKKIIGSSGANPPSFGDMRTIVGSNNATFNIEGVDNAVISVAIINSGVSSADRLWIKVRVFNYANQAQSTIVHNHTYTAGAVTAPILLPLYNLLQSQMNTVSIQLVATNAAMNTEVSLHHVDEPAPMPDYQTAAPYHQAIATTIPTGLNIIMTVLTGGMLRGLQISVLNTTAPIGTYVALYVGTALANIIPLCVIPANDMNSLVVDCFRPIPLDTAFASIWAFTTAPAGVSIGLVVMID